MEAQRDIALLYRRAGFGPRPGQVEDAAATVGGYDALVDTLTGPTGPDRAAEAIAPPAFRTAELVAELAAKDPSGRQALRTELRREAGALILWWLRRMVAADQPFVEKLTWFWHGHFATSLQKVRLPELMYRQNQTQRRLGRGDFEALVNAMAVDPAMLVWLDGRTNRAGHPNENFGREVLERFVLGHGAGEAATGGMGGRHPGDPAMGQQPYTEADVEAAARAFTGYRLDRGTLTVTERPRLHDAGAKTFLGQSGPWDGPDIVRIATHAAASAPFVTSRLWSRLARPGGPGDPTVVALARGFAVDRDVQKLSAALFRHPEFRADATRTGLVKQPVEWLAGACRALAVDPHEPRLVPLLAALGQVPFVPPSVGGWPAGQAWLTTGAALERLKVARLLVAAAGRGIDPVTRTGAAGRPEAAARLLAVDAWGPATTSALARAADDPATLVALALVAPEHLLA